MLRTRCVFEVLKLTSAEDVLRSTSTVSTAWLQASVSDDLWEQFAYDQNHPSDTVRYPSAQERFKQTIRRIKQVAVLGKGGFHIFTCRSEGWKERIPIPRDTNVNEWSSFAFLLDGSIFACGGDKALNESRQRYCSDRTFRINRDGITLLNNMTCGRERHGLILFQAFVFVFGGRSIDSPLRSCEKLRIEPMTELADHPWENLPNMLSARFAFNPCADRNFIYLCGGNTNAVESFYPETNTFAPLQFKLPDEGFSHCAVICGLEVLVLSRGHLSKWHMKKKKLEVLRHSGLRGNASGYMNGVVYRNCVFKPYIGAVWKFNLNTCKETEIQSSNGEEFEKPI